MSETSGQNLDSSAEDVERAARATTEVLVEITSASYDRAAAYTNLVTLAGYAGLFSIWGFTNSVMSKQANAAIALLLGFSLVVFVAYEIYKMVFTFRSLLPMVNFLNKKLPPVELLKELNELQLLNKRTSVTHQLVLWGVVMGLCVIPAVAAGGLLFYNEAATLLGWPYWPS